MSEIKIYTDKEQEDATMASEPVVTYHTTNLQRLKNRLKITIEEETDETMLRQCLELLQRTHMPCIYTDEEFAQVVTDSEASGYLTHEEALRKFEKWGFAK